MSADPDGVNETRPLTDAERRLARWMLENGSPEARSFLPQLDNAEAAVWRCPCGCASFNFRIKGRPKAPSGVHPLVDFVFGDSKDLSGVFIFENAGILSGLEVHGIAGDAPTSLPTPESLRLLSAFD